MLSKFQAQKYCFARRYSECGPFYLLSPVRLLHTHTFTHTNPNTHTCFCTTTQHTHTPKLNSQSPISTRQVTTHQPIGDQLQDCSHVRMRLWTNPVENNSSFQDNQDKLNSKLQIDQKYIGRDRLGLRNIVVNKNQTQVGRHTFGRSHN